MDVNQLKVCDLSGYAQRSLQANPFLAETVALWVSKPINEQAVDDLWQHFLMVWQSNATPGKEVTNPSNSTELAKLLRVWRNAVLITLAERSIRGQANLNETTQAVSFLANRAVQIALDHSSAAIKTDYGVPLDASGQPQDLMVVGMGKLGAYELNVSSDIDLILLYREQGVSSGDAVGQGKLAVSEYFAKLIKMVLPLIEAVTADGFVFRVDLRLRPHGDAGPIAVSLNYLEDYLVTEGRAWERFAWMKSRLIASTKFATEDARQADAKSLAAIVNPFVFRRYLDYSAIAALRDLHGLIQKEQNQRQAKRPDGFDVKLGRGGIREIEFIVQLMQIIRAGRDASLREKSTLSALDRLERAKVLSIIDANDLRESYRLLRDVEHAIQWREDQQTHWLARDNEVQVAQVAGFLGISSSQLWVAIDKTRKRVTELFDLLLAQPKHTPMRDEETEDNSLEIVEPSVTTEFETQFYAGTRFGRASDSTQTQAKALIERAKSMLAPLILDAPTTIRRLLDLFEKLIGRPGYLALLMQFPKALERLCKLLAHSSWAAQFITRYPIVIDELIADNSDISTDWAQLGETLFEQLSHADLERQLDLLREFHHGQSLRLMMLEVEGLLSVETLADELSALADLIINQTLRCLEPTDPPFAVIAYGKLGGKELGYASDLDIVFLYNDDNPDAQDRYAKLARKLIQWLTVPTGAGELFEVDLRLRPDGDSGLLVSSVNAFHKYQLEKAWLWEHQALTRARFCAGNAQVGALFETVRHDILVVPRDARKTQDEISQMRTKVKLGHPNRSELFDLKHDQGGMVDIEFAMQCFVLIHANRLPQMTDNIGNVALLKLAALCHLIDPILADECAVIYRDMRRQQYLLRLNGQQEARVDNALWLIRRQKIAQLWQQVFSGMG